MKPTGCALILLLASTCSAHAAYWVQEINGKPECCRVIRGKEQQPLKWLMPLETGDRIAIDKDSEVVVVADDGVETKLTSNDTPFFVPKSPPPAQWWNNLSDYLHTLVTEKMAEKSVHVAVYSRGDEAISLLGITSEVNFISAGQKSVTLQWLGGVEPFKVTLFDAGGSALQEKADLQSSHETLDLRACPLGDYTILVEEMRDLSTAIDEPESQTITIRVVPPESRPEKVRALERTPMPEAIKQRYMALLLSEDPEWRLQGLQYAHRLGDKKLLELVIGAEQAERQREAMP